MDGNMFGFRQMFLPRRCLICQDSVENNEWICCYCRPELPFIHSACPVCGMPSVCNSICGRCLTRPPYYQFTVAPLRFKPPVNTLVYRLKYHHQFFLARALVHELGHHILANGAPLPEAIIPLPLHKKRLRQRGFNQSLLLAQALSRQLAQPLKPKGLQLISPLRAHWWLPVLRPGLPVLVRLRSGTLRLRDS